MSKFSEYKIIKKIGSGGNANVFLAQIDGSNIALKILKNDTRYFTEKKNRFCIETKLVQEIQSSMDGIIPIFDAGLPDSQDKKLFWYVMPLALPISSKLNGNETIKEICQIVIELADVMTLLHERGIVHRDIKPSNIYFFNNKYCFGDFGLVDYPGKDNITHVNETVGAKATIAPEMKRNAKSADGKKADVYSISKTLWMLLTRNETGFDGIYDFSSNLMGLSNYYIKEHLVELEQLLYDSTREEPSLRPTMRELSDRLRNYIEIYSDYEKSNLSQWKHVQKTLFGDYIPDSASWTNIDDIVNVLNLLGRMPNLNHMFTPSGGGMDFQKAEKANENDCICLHAFSYYILKPKILKAENINKDYIWSYFRLELDELEPIEKFDTDTRCYEFLTEDTPGNYISWMCGNYGYYQNGSPLPEGYRLAERYLKGSFVLFSKASLYNDISGTYDARHNYFSTHDFRRYIELLRKLYFELPYDMFMELANINPFSKDETNDDILIKEERIKDIKRCKEYINDNFLKWDFKDLCKQQINCGSNLAYIIDFNSDNMWKDYYISDEGKIKEQKRVWHNFNIEGHYLLYNKLSAYEFVDNCEKLVEKQCKENEVKLSITEKLFNIRIVKIGKPNHLFTKDEIKKLYIDADDSQTNTLVIDEGGYALLIPNIDNPFLYPVRHESFGAFNNYVGKYSNHSTLNDDYISSLQGWLLYLKSGRSVYMDYVHEERDVEKLIDEINKFY